MARLAVFDRAREQVRVARSLRELPRIRAAFASGALSYSKVRALTRVAEPEMEAELTELAREATAAQLERLMRGYRAATTDASERVAERRHLTMTWDEDGGLVIRGYLPPEEGAELLKALDASREALAADEGDSAPEPGPAGDADTANAGSQRRSLSTRTRSWASRRQPFREGSPQPRAGDRHQVVVHVDAADLTGDQGAAGAGSCLDGFLPAEAVRRIACDASIVALVERDGEPLSVGRKSRSVPPAIKRALQARDGGCRFPGCDRRQWVDAHHITHWARGGETSLDNLVQLCRHQHRLVHEGGFSVESAPGGPVFRRPSGSRIEPAAVTPRGAVSGLIEASRAASGRRRPADCRPGSAGEPVDLDLAVLTLATIHGRRSGADRKIAPRELVGLRSPG